MQAGVERKVSGVKHMGQQERVIEDIDDWEKRVRGKREDQEIRKTASQSPSTRF